MPSNAPPGTPSTVASVVPLSRTARATACGRSVATIARGGAQRHREDSALASAAMTRATSSTTKLDVTALAM